MNKYKRLGKNTLFVIIGNFGAKALGFLLLPFYTRWLSVEDYGVTDIINVYVSFLVSIVSCCIAEAVFIFPKNASKKQATSYFTSAITFVFFSIVVTGLIFLIISQINTIYESTNSFFTYIWYIYLLLFTTILQSITQQFSRSIDKMAVYSTTGIIMCLCTLLFSIYLIPRYGVIGYIISQVFANSIVCIYTFVFSKSYLYFNLRSLRCDSLKQMLKYSIPLIPNGIIWWLVAALNRPLMEYHLGLHEIGLYAVANKFSGILSMMVSVIMSAFQISIVEEYGKVDFERFFNKILRISFILVISGQLFITIISRGVVSFLTTDEYYNSFKYIPILSLSVCFSYLSSYFGCIFSAIKQGKYFFYSSLAGALISVVLNLVLIPILGTLGAALSTLGSFVVMALSRYIYASNFVKLENKFLYIHMSIIAILYVVYYLCTENIYMQICVLIIVMLYLFLLNKKCLCGIIENIHLFTHRR